jgi:hypothetical protein
MLYFPYTDSLQCGGIRWCAVEVHDRQDRGIGRRIARGSGNSIVVGNEGKDQCMAQNTPNS